MNKLKNISLKEEFSMGNTFVIHDVLINKSNNKKSASNPFLIEHKPKTRKFSYQFNFQKDIKRDYLPENIFLLIPQFHLYSFSDDGVIRNNKLQIFFDKIILKNELISVYFEYKNNDLSYIGFGKNNNVCEAFDVTTPYDKNHMDFLDKTLMKSQIKKRVESVKKVKILKF